MPPFDAERVGAGYPRVSTIQQEEEGTSLQTQEDAILKLAAEINCPIKEEYMLREQGSGANRFRAKYVELQLLGCVDNCIKLGACQHLN